MKWFAMYEYFMMIFLEVCILIKNPGGAPCLQSDCQHDYWAQVSELKMTLGSIAWKTNASILEFCGNLGKAPEKGRDQHGAELLADKW